RRPPVPSLIVALGRHDHADSRLMFNDGLNPPTCRAHKPMRGRFGIVCLGAKPRKANRDSPADRLTFLPARLCAQKENLAMPSRLPGGDLCAVQVHLAFGRRTCDLDSWQTAVPLTNSGHSRNSELSLEFIHI